MTVAIREVGCSGRLDLRFAERNGRTVIRDSYCEVPFKITRLLDCRNSSFAHLILMQCTAGIFGGDRLECTIHVESGARVRISQQAAMKVHPSQGRLALLSTSIRVEPDAELIFECEPVIPFAESRLNQKTMIDLAPGSRLVYWEALMAGRIGRNELWKFDELSSETRLETEGRPLFLDRFQLVPGRGAPCSQWEAGNATYVGTGIYFGPDAPGIAERLHQALPDSGSDSLTSNLAVARVVSASGPDFHRSRATFLSTVGAGDERSECKPDKAQPSMEDRAQCLNQEHPLSQERARS